MGRITARFARLKKRGEPALVPFVMAGDPNLDATRALLRAAADAGADLVELGVPFSDPTADGPILQRSATRALRGGASLSRVLELVAEFRTENDLPIVLFGYYNPIFHYGPERLAADAKRAGVDGLLVVDLPPEEADELLHPAARAGLDVIFLLAPTSDEHRVRAVLRKARGFVYLVSMTGVTGSKAVESEEVRGLVEGLRSRCKLPIGVGFGISSPEQVASIAAFADAVIVGSAIMRLVEEQGGASDLVEAAGGFIRRLKEATRRPAPAAA
jgi:tryptophan synthase alpha chain